MSDEILIGEGVVLDARPASFASRAVGAALDAVALAVVAVIVMTLGALVAIELDEAAGAALGLALLVLLTVGVPATVETLSRGRSLGKLVMGIRVVRDDGGPIRFRHAVTRALLAFVELYASAGSIALITSLAHPKGKRLGDVVAGTYAVRIRGGQRALPPVHMPPHLAPWAHSADIRRLPDGLALSARQFLGRAESLHAGSRARLGVELAGEVEKYVAPGPPPGTHPELFLAAVLAERRDRELVRATQDARRAEAEGALVHRLPHSIPDPVD